MTTQVITSCDGGSDSNPCEEAVAAHVVLQALRQSLVNQVARQDACNDHVGDLVNVLWENREDLLRLWVQRESKEDGWRYHQITVLAAD